MKIILRKSKFPANPEIFLRRANYAYIYDRRAGHGSFVRRLSGGHYPRFHLYVEEEGEFLVFNLHLDQQKETVSFINSRHKGEYDGPAVEAEVARLKGLIRSEMEGMNFFK